MHVFILCFGMAFSTLTDFEDDDGLWEFDVMGVPGVENSPFWVKKG